MNWQPIETAPKDGAWILVVDYTDDESFGVAYWFAGDGEYKDAGWYSTSCCDDITMFYPTHWMPLPQPPKD